MSFTLMVNVILRSLLLFWVRVLGVCFGVGVRFPLVCPLYGSKHTRTHIHLSLLCRVGGCCGFFLPPGDQV